MVRATVEELLFDESTNEVVRGVLPGGLLTLFELVTHLGDGATIVGLAIVFYWFGAQSRSRDRALVLAVGLGTLAIVASLKGIVAAPRPDTAFSSGAYSGYGFPSAHAMGTAAVYTVLAARSTLGTNRQRYAIAGVVIVVVALSRVVIGVHYLGDVVAGVAVGLAFVVIVLRDRNPEPGSIFALAGVVAIGAFLLGSTEFTTTTIGASLGATIAWVYVSRRPSNPNGASILVLGVIVLSLLFVLRGLSVHFTAGARDLRAIEIVGYALVTGAALVVPNVAERLDDWSVSVRLQSALPFDGRTIDTDRLAVPFFEE